MFKLIVVLAIVGTLTPTCDRPTASIGTVIKFRDSTCVCAVNGDGTALWLPATTTSVCPVRVLPTCLRGD